MPDEAVIDASVAFKLIVDEPDSPVAEALVLSLSRVGASLIAPPFFPFEIINGLHHQVVDGKLTPAAAIASFRNLMPFRIRLTTATDLHERALVLADQLGQGSAYDSHYLALAQTRDCDFWTADHRFFSAVQRHIPRNRVRLLGDFNPNA